MRKLGNVLLSQSDPISLVLMREGGILVWTAILLIVSVKSKGSLFQTNMIEYQNLNMCAMAWILFFAKSFTLKMELPLCKNFFFLASKHVEYLAHQVFRDAAV